MVYKQASLTSNFLSVFGFVEDLDMRRYFGPRAESKFEVALP